jgi:hypothetical protein
VTNTSIGVWLGEDGVVRKVEPNLYRYVGNHPTNAADPSGYQKKPLGLQIIDFGKAPPPSSPTEKERDRETSLTKLEDTLTDGKLGYAFTFDFVVAQGTPTVRRYGLQAVKSYFFVIGPDGTLTRPEAAKKVNDYYTFKIDQTELVAPAKLGAPTTFQDIRALLPFNALEGTPIASDPKKTIPAVFALEIVEAEAGISKLGYTPERDKSGKLLSNFPTTPEGYKKVLDGIELQRTKTVTYHVFYNPKNCKGQDDPAKFVLDAIKTADPEARKQVDAVLKKLKLTLEKQAFEVYSFPEFGAPLVGKPK